MVQTSLRRDVDRIRRAKCVATWTERSRLPKLICNAISHRIAMAARYSILVLNAGSSSVKFGVFSADEAASVRLNGAIKGLGTGCGRLEVTDAAGAIVRDEVVSVSDQEEAIEALLDRN